MLRILAIYGIVEEISVDQDVGMDSIALRQVIRRFDIDMVNLLLWLLRS